MTDPKKPKPTTEAVARELRPAAASSDPAVHKVLADRQTAVLNRDADATEAADKRLADLGYGP